MAENQKNQSVQRNQVGNQKRRFPFIEESDDNQNDPLKESSGAEDKQELTAGIKEQEDMKHPHKQGVTVSSAVTNNSGI